MKSMMLREVHAIEHGIPQCAIKKARRRSKCRAPTRQKELNRAVDIMAILDVCNGKQSTGDEDSCPDELEKVYAVKWTYDQTKEEIVWEGDGDWRPAIFRVKGTSSTSMLIILKSPIHLNCTQIFEGLESSHVCLLST